MDVKAFEYLVTLAEYGNVTKAANQLFISQSALSKFIRNLESEMETQLFSRIGKRFVPTYAGEKCIEAAKKILAINAVLDEDIGKVAKQNHGRIRLAFHSSWSDCFFMQIYPAFQKRFPDVNIKLFEINSDTALQMLDSGELDMAIISSKWSNHSRFVCKTLYAQQMVLAVRENHPLIGSAQALSEYRYPFIDLKKLDGEPIVMRHNDQRTSEYMMTLFRENGIEPKVVLETRMRENALQAVEYGTGVTFTLDDPAMRLKHQNIRYLSFCDPNPDNYINLVYNKGAFFTDAEEALIQLVVENYRLLGTKQ
jgi:Transcriptional regulator